MGKGFRKFKRKMLVGAVWRSLVLALSIVAAAVAGQWLYAKMNLLEADFLRYASLGAAPALAAGGIVLLFLWPTNRRLARRLDAALGLGERAQTMIAFKHDQSEMAALQRADAEAMLVATPRRRLRGVCTWLFIALPVMAALMVVGTVMVPAKEPPAPPPVVDTGWKFDVFMEQKLKDLILYVRESDMEEDPRESVVGELEGLRIKLGTIRKEKVMRETVIATIVKIHETVSEHNTYDVVAAALEGTPSEAIRKLGNSIYTLKPLLISEQLKAMKETLVGTGTADEEPRSASATHMAAAIEQALAQTEISQGRAVTDAMETIAANLRTVTDDTDESALDDLFLTIEESLNKSLEPQMINETVSAYTVNRLMEIFGIPKTDIPAEVFEKTYDPTTEGEYKPNDDDQDHNEAGGLGSGEVLYGSNDTIYDPDKGDYTAYGEVLTKYYATVLEHIGDGTLPEELEDMFYDYFAKLHNGSDLKEED